MPATETVLPPVNQQGLDIRSTPRQEMNLPALDTFSYEFVGREIRINFEIPEFTAICPFSDFPTSQLSVSSTCQTSAASNSRA